MFRDSCNGIPVLVNLVDAALFGPSPKGGSVSVQATPTDEDVPRLKVSPCNLTREGVACLTTPISVRQCSVLCEALKILFNQTLNWKEEYDEVRGWCECALCVSVCVPRMSCVCGDASLSWYGSSSSLSLYTETRPPQTPSGIPCVCVRASHY